MNISEPDINAGDEAVARKLAALAHPARLRLLRHLGAADSCCVKDLVRRGVLAQSTVSQHLKVLVEADLVSFRPERQSSRYSINASALRELAGVIGQTLDHCCGGGCCASGDGKTSDLERQAHGGLTAHKDM